MLSLNDYRLRRRHAKRYSELFLKVLYSVLNELEKTTEGVDSEAYYELLAEETRREFPAARQRVEIKGHDILFDYGFIEYSRRNGRYTVRATGKRTGIKRCTRRHVRKHINTLIFRIESLK